MLVLLIIFMVVTPMLQKGVTVDMAKVENPEEMQDADKDDAILIAVTRDGRYFLGTTQISLDDITDKVKDLLANRLDKTVFVKSDARAKYGDVVKAVDEVRSAGVDNLGLLTEKLETTARLPPPPPAQDESNSFAVKEFIHGNGSWPGSSGALFGDERRAADRHFAGADHYFHGDHAYGATGSRRSGSAAGASKRKKIPALLAKTIVVQVTASGKVMINQDETTWDQLGPRLEDIFKQRAEKVAFVKGDDSVDFAEVARAIDIMRANGVDKVGLITAKVEAGSVAGLSNVSFFLIEIIKRAIAFAAGLSHQNFGRE